MNISATAIENKLWDIYFAGEEAYTYESKSAADAIKWYVSTGRAYPNWIKALFRANPRKIVAYVAREGGSTNDMVKKATSYLRRYCGLKHIPYESGNY